MTSPCCNTVHPHTGLGLLTPYDLHRGPLPSAPAILAAACAIHPGRFHAGGRQPPAHPTEVWMNPPKTRAAEETLPH